MKSREIILIRPADPALGDFKDVGASQHPVNLLYLATWLNRYGFSASVFDLEVEPQEKLEEAVRRRPPLLAGITVMTTGIGLAAGLCGMLKRAGVKTVVGGPHASALPAETLRDTGADFVVSGEGEGPLLELARALDSGGDLSAVKGLAFMRDGRAVVNERPEPLPVDSLPIPDRTLLKLDLYGGYTTPGVPAGGAVMFASRGCPYDCGFCASRAVSGGRFRRRSLDAVMQEIEYLASLGFAHITIDDDTLTSDKGRMLDFCSRLAARKKPLTWNCAARVDRMDRETMTAMRDAGCVKIAFGVESGSQRVLDFIGKGITPDMARGCFALARELGIVSQAFFMVGHPEETPEDLLATERLIRELGPDLLFLSVAAPLPGTRYRDYLKEKGWLPDIPWGDYAFFRDGHGWRTRCFTGKELASARKRISRGYYFSTGYIMRRLAALRRPSELAYLARGAWAALRAFRPGN
jgi:anaerobic magnesium-protoporphyrin IX monomethyl ester cyclase